MGKELIDIVKGQYSVEEKSMAIKNFREMIDFTFSHPITRQFFIHNKSNNIFVIKELPYALTRYLDEIYDQYVEAQTN